MIAFLTTLVVALLPGKTRAFDVACPDEYCGIEESCPGPAGLYWQYFDESCTASNCRCKDKGDCTYEHAGYHLCDCSECLEQD
jgi:hypothetical protein